MTQIISKDSVSFNEIKANVNNWISGLDNAAEIYSNIPASNMQFIVDLIAGYASYDNMKRVAESNQTYISEATRSSSIFKIARAFGYNINRYTAPTIQVKYNDIPTITLSNGQSLGNIGTIDIIYWGDDKVIEKGDVITLVLGHYHTEVHQVDSSTDIVEYSVSPINLEAIDNNKIAVLVDSTRATLTKDIEAYIIHNSIIDWSDTRSTTTLSIADRSHKYGAEVDQTVTIEWIETNGPMTITQQDLELDSRFIYLSTSHAGTTGDSDDKIKRMAPLYYSTQRRMVSRLDHRYIIESNVMIKSCYPDVDPGEPEVVKFTVKPGDPSGITYTLQLGAYTHTYTGHTGDSSTDIINGLLKTISNQGDITIQSTTSDSMTLEFNDTLIAPSYNAGTQFTATKIESWVRPRCCTMNVYYVKNDTVDQYPKVFTQQELLALSDFLEVYKMVGYRIVFVPATAIVKELKLSLRVIDDKYWDRVVADINKIIASYELIVNKEFSYGELLARIGKIAYIIDGQRIKPVEYIAPDQDMFDIDADDQKYIYFSTATITPKQKPSTNISTF